MKRASIVGLVVLGGIFTASVGTAQQGGEGVLDLPLTSSPAWKSIPLRDALGHLGSAVGGDSYVLFGLEEELYNGQDPRVDLEVEPEMTLGGALHEILAQLPPYELEVVSDHLINLRPVGAKQDTNNILNLVVPSFDAVSQPAYIILSAPLDVIPELNEALTPKPEPGKHVITLYSRLGGNDGPPITLHPRNATIRAILNAASEATEPFFPDQDPHGWVYAFDPDPPAGHLKHSWQALFSMQLHSIQRKKSGQKSPDK